MHEPQPKGKQIGLYRRLLPGARTGIILVGVAVFFLLAGFLVGQSAGADSGPVPGSEQDPLVTASWVEARLDALAQALREGHLEREGPEDRMQKMDEGEYPRPGEVVRIVEPAPAYTVVVVEVGEQVLTGEGTEFILRSGRAKALVPLADTGLVDLTTGKTLNNNDFLNRDHLLLSPREDGRGVTAETQAIFLIKGTYKII